MGVLVFRLDVGPLFESVLCGSGGHRKGFEITQERGVAGGVGSAKVEKIRISEHFMLADAALVDDVVAGSNENRISYDLTQSVKILEVTEPLGTGRGSA